jgi:hypothetical protein
MNKNNNKFYKNVAYLLGVALLAVLSAWAAKDRETA